MYFRNDYSETCHPAILEALAAQQGVRSKGYGEDEFTAKAASTIRRLAGSEDLSVHFLAGGTVSNLVAISSALWPHEAVLAAETAHINVHETGAIEASGHKILTVSTVDGKLRLQDLEPILKIHQDPARVKPRMVYISNSTEVGTIYKKAELETLSAYCREKKLLLFLDGARLGAALASPKNDLTLTDIAQLTDMFYIGGTKNGALFGEALVTNLQMGEEMPRLIKNRGAMLAKGFVPAIMFERLLETAGGDKAEQVEDTLYFSLAAEANRYAFSLADLFTSRGFTLTWPAESNQIFVTLPLPVRDYLAANEVVFEVDHETDEQAVCRFVLTATTTAAEIDQLEAVLEGALEAVSEGALEGTSNGRF